MFKEQQKCFLKLFFSQLPEELQRVSALHSADDKTARPAFARCFCSDDDALMVLLIWPREEQVFSQKKKAPDV